MLRPFFVPDLSKLSFPHGLEQVRFVAAERKWLLRIVLVAYVAAIGITLVIVIPSFVHAVRLRLLSLCEPLIGLVLGGITVLIWLYVQPTPLLYLRYIWGGRDSWKNVYNWDEQEKRLTKRTEAGRRAILGIILLPYILLFCWLSAIPSGPASFVFPDRYREYKYAEAYAGPDKTECRAYVVWREHRGTFVASDARSEGFDYGHLLTQPLVECVRRGDSLDWHGFPANRTLIERYLAKNPERPLFDEKAKLRYRFFFGDLATGRYTSAELCEAEVAAAGVNLDSLNLLLPPAEKKQRRQGR
jgi:hypothetical protein